MKENTKKIMSVVFVLVFFFIHQRSIGQTVIKMQKEGGVYTVPCKVNGLALKFIFDTGASDVSISATEALFMLKNGYLDNSDLRGEQNYFNANGEISTGTVILIREIEFSGLKLKNVQASVVHSLDAPLLLGQSALEKLGKYQIDGSNLTILNGPNGTYSFPENSSSNSSISNSNNLSGSAYYNSLPNYSGTVKVYGCSPILQSPDLVNSKIIGMACDNKVTIIRKENSEYYYVSGGQTTGFLWSGWIKNEK